VASSCASAKPFHGTVAAASRVFDSYLFTACRATCLSTSVTSSNAVNLFEVDYSPSFDPTNIATNYAGDAGASSNGQTCAINTVASTDYEIVLHDVPGTAAGSSYSLQLPVCMFRCNANTVPVALAHNVTVTAATLGGTANASIDNGSSDADGDALTITQSPAEPYPIGTTSVRLTVVDTKGATAQATANVTVLNPDDFTVAPHSSDGHCDRRPGRDRAHHVHAVSGKRQYRHIHLFQPAGKDDLLIRASNRGSRQRPSRCSPHCHNDSGDDVRGTGPAGALRCVAAVHGSGAGRTGNNRQAQEGPQVGDPPHRLVPDVCWTPDRVRQ
jgi:hypothetical protein